ncbi:MAG TPA: aminotransferase class I/II-fold pyridoxal phosphate-dependent enzyme, partial [Desulfobacterales bacterium]|nr:aminotransferase class I/II-fold pyridoxal phosphate-dependent enzyme [Desulfobacterales bacterium]
MTVSSLYEHGGNVHEAAAAQSVKLDSLLDFSANINPLGPPDWLRSCISRELDTILHYPDPTAKTLKKCIAKKYNLPENTVLVANGTTELLYQLPRVIDCKRAVIPVPCYIDYLKVMDLAGIEIKTVQLTKETDFEVDLDLLDTLIIPGDLLILGTPNNPTGRYVDSTKLQELANKHPEVLFLIDEAFLEFVPGHKSLAGSASNIITLHSLTKFYAIPGLRLGYGVFP